MSPTASSQNIELARDPRLAPLREVAGKVVGAVFYGTLLKTMRASPLRSELGHGGRGEKVFEAQLDAELAQRAGRASRNELTVALFERLSSQQLRIERVEENT